jgi:hypothetical protein
MNQLFSSIVEMSKEADHLRKQNEFWIAKVQDYQVFVDAIHQVQEEKNNDPQYRDMNAIEYQLDTESFERQNHWNHFRYSPKSDLELSQCVVQYTREIEALQQIHLEKEPFHQKDGWTMHMKEVEGDMIFLITRKYAHIDPHTAMERAWFHDTKTMDEYRKKQPNILRLQMLQEIQIPGFEDQTYMIGRDVEEQGIIFRTIYLFFRMATERGYLIGSQSLNPSPEEQKQQRLGSIYEDKLHWADASYS